MRPADNYQRIVDIIDQTEGACEIRFSVERHRLFNPFYWLIAFVRFVLRIPFLLFQTTGFHIEKFEEQLWGRFFKLLELLAKVYFLIWVGATKPDIKHVVLTFLHVDQTVGSATKAEAPIKATPSQAK